MTASLTAAHVRQDKNELFRRHALGAFAELLRGDGELVVELAVGGMDGGFLAEDNPCHPVDEGGEQERVGVLALGGASRESIEMVGIEDSWQDGSGRDADGLFLNEGLEDFVQEHVEFPPQGP